MFGIILAILLSWPVWQTIGPYDPQIYRRTDRRRCRMGCVRSGLVPPAPFLDRRATARLRISGHHTLRVGAFLPVKWAVQGAAARTRLEISRTRAEASAWTSWEAWSIKEDIRAMTPADVRAWFDHKLDQLNHLQRMAYDPYFQFKMNARRWARDRWRNPKVLNEMANIRLTLARYGRILGPGQKLGLRLRHAKLKVIGGGSGGGGGKDTPPDVRKEKGSRARKTMIPGIVTGKMQDIVPDDSDDPDILFRLEDKHLTRMFDGDGGIWSIFRIPYMEETEELDPETGEAVKVKAYTEYTLGFVPETPATDITHVALEKDAVLGHETRFRDKVLRTVTRKVKDPDGNDIEVEEKVYAYEKDEEGNDVRVQEEYVHYIHGDKPPRVEYAHPGMTIHVEERKGRSKETITTNDTLGRISWKVSMSPNLVLVQERDLGSGMFGAIYLEDANTGERLPGTILPPTAHDAEGYEIAVHYELRDGNLILVVDDDLAVPATRTFFQRRDKVDEFGDPVLKDGQPIQELVEVSEKIHEWVAPFVFDPTITWDGTKIQVSGSGVGLRNIKTLYAENFCRYGGSDGDAIDTYDSDWSKTVAGTSVAEIDTAQYYVGTASLRLYRDGTNNVQAKYGIVDGYDNVRYKFMVRPAQTTCEFRIDLTQTEFATTLCEVAFNTSSNIVVKYGNGAGGVSGITAKSYSAGNWYKIEIDVDVTNDKVRYWVDGVLYEGANSDSGGWDNFYNDRTTTVIDGWYLNIISGTGEFAVDDITIELGDETYNYGLLPYDGDELTEAVSPTGTLSGMDGDWSISVGSGANMTVDNTDFVIGTQSITQDAEIADDASGGIQIDYVFDTNIDVSNYEGLEGYVKANSSTGGLPDNLFNIRLWDSSSNKHVKNIVGDMVENKWYRFKLAWGDFTTTSADLTDIDKFNIYADYTTGAGTQTLQIWVDGLRFYGARNGRGAAWSSQSIQTESGVTTQLNRSVPMPLRHSDLIKEDTSLEHLFPLHDSITDVSGHGYDLTDGGTITYSGNPLYGGDWDAADFDGSTDYLYRSGNTELESLTDMSIGVWFKTDDLSNIEVIWYVWGADNDRFWLRKNASTIEFYDDIDNANTTYYVGELVANRWYHVLWVNDATNNDMQIYLDGKLVVDTSFSKDIAGNMTNADIYVGAGWAGAAASGFFDGQISDFAIYSEAKDADWAMLRAGAGKDLYIDDSKGITFNASGKDEMRGRRFPEEPNEWCEGDTTNWSGVGDFAAAETSLSDAVYGSKSMRFTRDGTGTAYAVFHSGYDLNADLQRIAGAKSTVAKEGKIAFWAKASDASEQIYGIEIDMAGSSSNYCRLLSINTTLTSYWKKYEYDLSSLTTTAGTPDWSDVDRIYLAFTGGANGATVDINDLHFEERCVTDRSTGSGAYDIAGGGTFDWRYAEVKNWDGAFGHPNATFTIKHCTSEVSGQNYAFTQYTAVDGSYYEDIRLTGSVLNEALYNVWCGGRTYTNYLIQDDTTGGSGSVRVYEDSAPWTDMVMINCIIPDGVTHMQSTNSLISYNENNVNGTHKAYGTVPFTSSSVSDFPRSKTRLTNSSKGYSIVAGRGTIEQTQDGTLFVTNDDGADTGIEPQITLPNSIDIGPQSDTDHPNNIKIKIKTDNADAGWTIQAFLSTAGIGTDFLRYDSNQANDIDTTVSIDCSGAPDGSSGSTDRTNITEIIVYLSGIASSGETVRAWISEVYFETDAGKVMLAEENATVNYFALDPQTNSTIVIDEGSTIKADDTAGAGITSTTGSATLKVLGASGNTVTMTSATAGTPTNHWAGFSSLTLDLAYVTIEKYSTLTIDVATTDLDYVTLQNPGTRTLSIVDVTTEWTNSTFDHTDVDCNTSGIVFHKDMSAVDGDFGVVMANTDEVDFTEIANEPDVGDDVYLYVETGGTSATFDFNEAAKTVGDITCQSGKSITIKSNVDNLLAWDLSNNSTVTIDAVNAAKDCYITFKSDASASITIATGSTLNYTGSDTYRVYQYEAGRASVAGNGVITNSGISNGIDVTGGGTWTGTYAHILHMNGLHKSSTLTLTDSEYWFVVTTEPEEQTVAATWTLTRSLVSSYDSKKWYVKPTGTITMTGSILAHCLPTLYSASYYIVFYHGSWKLTEIPPPKETAESRFLGGDGAYSEVTSYGSARVECEGRVAYDDLATWDHPLDQRWFTVKLRELYKDQDETPKFTWNEGHYQKCTLDDLKTEQHPGEDDNTSSRTWELVISERPYN